MLIAMRVMSSPSTVPLPHTDAAQRGDQKWEMFYLRGYKTCRYNVTVPTLSWDPLQYCQLFCMGVKLGR